VLDPSRRLEVPGFPQASVYRDHQQAQTYYVVPWSAGIAIDANGRPECRLLLFVKRGPAGSIATGGQLSLTATLSIAAGDLARIKQSIESSLTPAAVAGEPPPRPVVVQLATPDWAGGRVNIWARDLGGGEPRQVTSFEDQDVHFPAIGPSDIVFEQAGRLWRLALADEQAFAILGAKEFT